MCYLYELHCHTSEVSNCGRVPAADVVSLLKSNGYTGVVITDHLTPEGFCDEPLTDWQKYIDRYLTGYRNAKAAADEEFDVLLGAEIRFPENDNDYLLFGVTEEFLRSNPYINHMSLREFSILARNNGILIIQAHPFRNNMVVVNPDYLDGYEVFNGNRRHDSKNEIAFFVSQLFRRIITSGSDFHQLEDLARGGIFSESRIQDVCQLTTLLKSGCYDLHKA